MLEGVAADLAGLYSQRATLPMLLAAWDGLTVPSSTEIRGSSGHDETVASMVAAATMFAKVGPASEASGEFMYTLHLPAVHLLGWSISGDPRAYDCGDPMGHVRQRVRDTLRATTSETSQRTLCIAVRTCLSLRSYLLASDREPTTVTWSQLLALPNDGCGATTDAVNRRVVLPRRCDMGPAYMPTAEAQHGAAVAGSSTTATGSQRSSSSGSRWARERINVDGETRPVFLQTIEGGVWADRVSEVDATRTAYRSRPVAYRPLLIVAAWLPLSRAELAATTGDADYIVLGEDAIRRLMAPVYGTGLVGWGSCCDRNPIQLARKRRRLQTQAASGRGAGASDAGEGHRTSWLGWCGDMALGAANSVASMASAALSGAAQTRGSVRVAHNRTTHNVQARANLKRPRDTV